MSGGRCIICGETTTNRVRVEPAFGRPYSHWRCPVMEHDQCADRRDMKRRRPRHRDAGLDLAIAAASTQPPQQHVPTKGEEGR